MSRLKWVSGEKQSPVDVGPVGQVGVQGEVGTAVMVYRHSVTCIGIPGFLSQAWRAVPCKFVGLLRKI